MNTELRHGRPIPARMELVSPAVNPSSIHGWHTCKLVQHQGTLYALAMKARPQVVPANLATDKELWSLDEAHFFRRLRGGRWELVTTIPPRVYSICIDPGGRFWLCAAAYYTENTFYRSRRALDLDDVEEMHRGTSGYLSNAVSPEGNFLALYAQDTFSYQAFVPSALTSAFYDQQTDQWHTQRIETPEGRYGYEGILLRGRRALAVMNSTIADPKANPIEPHFSFRHVRLLHCDDLTSAPWINKLWLAPEYGDTWLHDFTAGPDETAHLLYSAREGNSVADALAKPFQTCVARIHDDLRVENFPTGLTLGNPALLLFNSNRVPFLLGRPVEKEDLHLWRLDPHSFKAVEEHRIDGTAKLAAYIVHTLRPERFGGEANAETVHLLSCFVPAAVDGKPPRTVEMWHGQFELPR